MNLAELKCRIVDGKITVPKDILETMELRNGDEVCLVYLAENSLRNESKEFFIARQNGGGALENHMDDNKMKFSIPAELLEDAGIPEDADLEVVCTQGKIVILPLDNEEDIIPEELMAIFSELGISSDKVKVVLQTVEFAE